MNKYKNYIIAVVLIIIALTIVCFVPISTSKLIPKFEEQISSDLGVKVHMEHLVLQLGPSLKVKTPIMHMMYEDGQKFAQFDSVKFYIPWSSILKNKPVAKDLYAKKLILRINSDDKYLPELLNTVQNKSFSEIPNLHLKEYKFSFFNKENNDKYSLKGNVLDVNKVLNYENFKISAQGDFYINDKQYINYDLSINPKLDLNKQFEISNINKLLKQIEELDFHSDVITDLKLYKNQNDEILSSGFINVDNISVLDKNKKESKSFIYLTLWGDKASILSNIYTDGNKKIYLEGMINNSAKPVLDLKVKTDKISLNDLWNKLKIFADFSVLKGIDNINGFIEANFNLKGDLNKLKSNGYMKISDASLSASEIKIDNITSNIDLSNNSININDTVGYVNNSPIMAKGKIDNNINIELLMNKVELKYLCPTSLGVKNGVASLVANISGKLDNIIHKENLYIENLELENNSDKLKIESLKFDTNKSNTAFIKNIVVSTPQIDMLKIPSLNMKIDTDKITVPDTNIFMANSKLITKADVLNFNNKNITFNATLNGFINSNDIKFLNNRSTRYPIKASINGNKDNQVINLQALLEKTDIFDEPTLLNIFAKKEKDTLKLEDISISSFNGSFTDDFKTNLKGLKKIIITGLVENLNNPVLKNLRIFIPQQLNINVYDTLAQLKGDIFVNGKLDKPELVGQIFVQNLYNKPSEMNLSNCTIDFNKNLVTLNAPNIKIADSVMGVNATASTEFKDYINIKSLNIKSKYINTNTLLMYKDLPAIKSIPVKITDGKFYSERVNADLYNSPVYLSAFTCDFNIEDNILSAKNITSEMYNGKLGGSLNYNMNLDSYETKLMGRGVSAAPIFDIISPRKDSISGTMDFDMNLKGNLNSKNSVNGDLKFIIHNGRMSTLGKIEHLLYAQNVVADSMLRTSLSVVTKALTLKDTGIFKYLRGDLTLKNGIANIKMMQSQGPTMALFIKGQYNTLNDYARLTVLGRLSDEVVSGLGAFGDFSFNKLMVMLTGEDNKKYNITNEDLENLPQLNSKNTKEFRSIINGIVDKPSSVVLFNWISYSQKSLRQKEVPMNNVKLPSFIEELPY